MWPLGIGFRGDCGGADGAVGCLKVGLDDFEGFFLRGFCDYVIL